MSRPQTGDEGDFVPVEAGASDRFSEQAIASSVAFEEELTPEE